MSMFKYCLNIFIIPNFHFKDLNLLSLDNLNEIIWILSMCTHSEVCVRNSLKELNFVLIPVFNILLCNSRRNGGLRHCFRDVWKNSIVENGWYKVFPAEFYVKTSVSTFDIVGYRFPSQFSKSQSTCHFHFLINLCTSCIESCSEQKWETQHIVYLVRIVRSSSCNNCIFTHFINCFWSHLWLWVC